MVVTLWRKVLVDLAMSKQVRSLNRHLATLDLSPAAAVCGDGSGTGGAGGDGGSLGGSNDRLGSLLLLAIGTIGDIVLRLAAETTSLVTADRGRIGWSGRSAVVARLGEARAGIVVAVQDVGGQVDVAATAAGSGPSTAFKGQSANTRVLLGLLLRLIVRPAALELVVVGVRISTKYLSSLS